MEDDDATYEPELLVKKKTGRKKRSGGHERRPLRFWQPFNDWWRDLFDKLGRRPAAEDIIRWYEEEADLAWGEEKPSLQETRVHAKCLRSVTSVRDYFREYRAKKRGLEQEQDDDDDLRPHRRSRQQDMCGEAIGSGIGAPLYGKLGSGGTDGFGGAGPMVPPPHPWQQGVLQLPMHDFMLGGMHDPAALAGALYQQQQGGMRRGPRTSRGHRSQRQVSLGALAATGLPLLHDPTMPPLAGIPPMPSDPRGLAVAPLQVPDALHLGLLQAGAAHMASLGPPADGLYLAAAAGLPMAGEWADMQAIKHEYVELPRAPAAPACELAGSRVEDGVLELAAGDFLPGEETFNAPMRSKERGAHRSRTGLAESRSMEQLPRSAAQHAARAAGLPPASTSASHMEHWPSGPMQRPGGIVQHGTGMLPPSLPTSGTMQQQFPGLAILQHPPPQHPDKVGQPAGAPAPHEQRQRHQHQMPPPQRQQQPGPSRQQDQHQHDQQAAHHQHHHLAFRQPAAQHSGFRQAAFEAPDTGAAYDALPLPASSALVLPPGVSPAGILMELEAVKGPAMSSIVDMRCAGQAQRMSASLVDMLPWELPLGARRVSALQAGELSLPAGAGGAQGGRLSLRLMGSTEISAEADWFDSFLFAGDACDMAVLAAINQQHQLQHQHAGSQAGANEHHQHAQAGQLRAMPPPAAPSTGGEPAGSGHAAARALSAAGHRISHTLLPEMGAAPKRAARVSIGGVSNLLMELDTPRVRALPAGAFDGEGLGAPYLPPAPGPAGGLPLARISHGSLSMWGAAPGAARTAISPEHGCQAGGGPAANGHAAAAGGAQPPHGSQSSPSQAGAARAGMLRSMQDIERML